MREWDAPWRRWRYARPLDLWYLAFPLALALFGLTALARPAGRGWVVAGAALVLAMGLAALNLREFDLRLLRRWRDGSK